MDKVVQMIIKTYSELIKLSTFIERYRYLKLDGKVGEATFGFQRWLNQELYHSGKWLSFRDEIIFRDNGCDLAVDGFEIYCSILIHHINPVTYDDIVNRNPIVFDHENAISTKLPTHNAIHFGDERLLAKTPIERTPSDTCPWRHK